MARVLVTGATGFIGAALSRRLRHDGHEVLAPGREELDLLRPAIELPEGVEVLVHCAASRERGEDSPGRIVSESALNVAATGALYHAARARHIPVVVQVSTISVLQPLADTNALLHEDSPQVTPPTHPYALTKRWGEELALQLRNDFNALPIVRPGMVYGPSMSPRGSLRRIAERLRNGEPYRLGRPDGDRYAPVFIDDVVDVLAKVVVQPSNLVVNVSGPDAITERAMIEEMARCLRRSVTFEPTDDPVGSAATSVERVDALFPGRVRTPWHVGAPRAFA